MQPNSVIERAVPSGLCPLPTAAHIKPKRLSDLGPKQSSQTPTQKAERRRPTRAQASRVIEIKNQISGGCLSGTTKEYSEFRRTASRTRFLVSTHIASQYEFRPAQARRFLFVAHKKELGCRAETRPLQATPQQALSTNHRAFNQATVAGAGNPLRPGNSGASSRALGILSHRRSSLRRRAGSSWSSKPLRECSTA